MEPASSIARDMGNVRGYWQTIAAGETTAISDGIQLTIVAPDIRPPKRSWRHLPETGKQGWIGLHGGEWRDLRESEERSQASNNVPVKEDFRMLPQRVTGGEH